MIEDKIKIINSNIKNMLECKKLKLKKCAIYELAQTATYRDDEGSAVPLIITNDGEGKYIFSDDKYIFGCYHKILNKNYSESKGFGDNKKTVEVAEMILIVWGFSDKINMNAEQFESKIIMPSMPDDVMLVASDFDRYRVISGEFKGFNYEPKPEEFVFSVRYRVTSKYLRKCRGCNYEI